MTIGRSVVGTTGGSIAVGTLVMTSRATTTAAACAPHALGRHRIFTRLANRLSIASRSHQPNARHLTTTIFAAAMVKNHDARDLAHVTTRPNPQIPS
jgi:hypothetical protein